MIRNIGILRSIYEIDTIEIPERYSLGFKLLRDNFPSLHIETIRENIDESGSIGKGRRTFGTVTPFSTLKPNRPFNSGITLASLGSSGSGYIFLENDMEIGRKKIKQDGILHIPLNSVIWSFGTNKRQSILADLVTYPWNFLSITQKILWEEVKDTRISPDASVAKSCIIEGPCIIEEGAPVDDFTKIKGPIYIGKDSFIGMGSLVRNCMFENNTRIGFNCEIGKSYFTGNDKISHQNIILDSIIGENVWFGGYSGTANVLLDRRNVKYQIGNSLVNTGIDHFGAVLGNNCAIGASVIILPGMQIQPNSTDSSWNHS